MDTVAERIKYLRHKHNCTQEKLGKFAGVSKSAVSQWERGISEPERDSLLQLHNRLGISPEWIMRGKGYPDARENVPEYFRESSTGYRREMSELELLWNELPEELKPHYLALMMWHTGRKP